MKIALHTPDKKSYPNLALMKISTFHKNQGDQVEWFLPYKEYDLVYSSKVFSYSKDDPNLPKNTIRGGTGHDLKLVLDKNVENLFPDYSLYPEFDKAIGFLTRGCIRKCHFCVVPEKEGFIRPNATWQEKKRPDSNQILFMDNNILASNYGLSQLESMIGEKLRIDLNQGMDARLVTAEIADLLSRLKWIKYLRFSCDNIQILDKVVHAIKLVNEAGVKPYRIMIYVLIEDIESSLIRINELRKLGIELFAQPYRDYDGNEPQKELKQLARWVNHKAIFKTVAWEDYQSKNNK